MAKVKDLAKKYYDRALEIFGSSFYHDPVTLVMLSMFVVLLLGLLLMLIFRVQPSSQQFPLTYNIIYGVTYSSSWYGPYYYLAALLGFGVVNSLVAWALFDKERLLSYLIGCVNILLAALTILYVYNLTALVS